MNPRERLSAIEAELRSIHEAAGDASLSGEAQIRWDALSAERETVQAAIARDEARRAAVETFAARPAQSEGGDGAVRSAPNVNVRRDPFDLLESRGQGMAPREFSRAVVDSVARANEDRDITPENAAHFERIVRRHSSDRSWALGILARSRPEYESGWAKLMCGRSELLTMEERAAMSVGSNTNGGYLLPTHLDPTIILTNSGSSNVIRGISRTVTLTEGTTWNGVTSAGVTASWDGELVEVSDDSPTMGRVSIPTIVAQGFVQASIAAFDDISNLGSDVMMMFADARDRLEGAAHASGTGSGQPKGIVTALAASSGVCIVSTTAAVIGEVDIHSLYRNVPVRWRGRGSWLTNPLYSLAIKRLGTALSSSYSGDLTMPVTDRILGRPLAESDDMPTTQTTTALDSEIVYGDFSNYAIVDKPGGMSVEFVPHLFNTANNLPDGRRGWYAYWRTGADATNLAAFRLLQDKTSA
jgi:HK97 family phage major capsid protein